MCCSFTCFSSLLFKPGTLFLHRCLEVMKTVRGFFSSLYHNSQSRKCLERKKAQVPCTLRECVTEVMVWSVTKEANGYFVCLSWRSVTKTESWKATVLSSKSLSKVLMENTAEKKKKSLSCCQPSQQKIEEEQRKVLSYSPLICPLSI